MNRTILIYVIFAITFCRTLPQESKNNEFINSGIVVQDSDHDIIPFTINISEEELTELHRRINTTRWPDKETVNDHSQGIPLEKLQGLLQYWGSQYDWRKVETKLNSYPQYTTVIDSVVIHFIHVRSPHPNAMPLIMTHGWPGSIIELLKTIEPLTNPTSFGGNPEDAFDLVLPSIPGYGFSGKPTGLGWDAERIARAWAILMKRLGYNRYVAQGGDWGSPICEVMALQAPQGLLGIHINLPAVIPPEVDAALITGIPPAGLTENELTVFNKLITSVKKGNRTYFSMLSTRPQTVGYGESDSPASLAAWILLHPGFMDWSFGANPEQSPTIDDVLDDITLYWLTNSGASASRLYWENRGRSPLSSDTWKTNEIKLPVAVTVFRDEPFLAPETWVRRTFQNLIYFNEVEKGGHFAAWEQPQLFTEELRKAFRQLRKIN
ncbi:MAG: epoxide hydrolase [Ignavibacteria bacterium]|nr:epoxide hydrolase [Ignavibacteria bacterium]